MSDLPLSKSKILIILLYLIGVVVILADLFIDNILGNELSVGQRIFLCLLVIIYNGSSVIPSYPGKWFVDTVLPGIFIGFSIYILVFTSIIGYIYLTSGGTILPLYIPILIFNIWFVLMPIIDYIRKRRRKV